MERFANNIASLVRGDLKGKNRYNILLLGQKSVGKTTLLTSMGQACHDVLGSTVDVVSNDLLESDRLKDGLVRTIASQVGCPVRGPIWSAEGDCADRVQALEDFAQAHNRRIVIFLDEFQSVYSSEFLSKRESRTVLRELVGLVGRVNGRFFIVVTGSSQHLRSLAYCRMKVEEAKEASFDHYSGGINLNSTKLGPLTMRPISDANDFVRFMKKYNPEADMVKFYITSAGLPGLMNRESTRGDTLFAKAKDEGKSPELQALADIIMERSSPCSSDEEEEENSECISTLRELAKVTKFISKRCLSTDVANSSRWYDLADRGMVQLREGSNGEDEVAFGSYLAYFLTRTATAECNLSAIERAHFMAHNTKEAEQIYLRFLSEEWKK